MCILELWHSFVGSQLFIRIVSASGFDFGSAGNPCTSSSSRDDEENVKTVNETKGIQRLRLSCALNCLMDLAAHESEPGPMLAIGELTVSADASKLDKVLDIYRRLHAQVTAKVGHLHASVQHIYACMRVDANQK